MKRFRSVILLLLPLLFVALSLLVGRYSLSLRDVAETLLRPSSAAAEQYRVVWYLRLPRAVAAAMCGAALAASGAADIFNPNGSCTRAMIVTFLYRASK